MKRTEKHIVTKYNVNYKQVDHMCFMSKNLYNATLYAIRKYKESTGKFIRYNDIEKQFRLSNQPDYRSLPANSSQQIMMIVDKNLKSYFSVLSKWKKDKRSVGGCPVFSKYKHKTKGRNIVVFTTNQVRIKNGYLHFPKMAEMCPLKTKIEGTLKQVRIMPTSGCYKIEVVYESCVNFCKVEKNGNYISIDLGVNNLVTTYDNVTNKSVIINGKPLKSANQYYNKKKGKIQCNLKKKHNKNWSNRLDRLTFKRNNKIEDYLHKCSRIVVDYCIKNGISNIVIGYNKEWKQNANMGKVSNQKFSCIPHLKLVSMIKYKGTSVGIDVMRSEESYTSKCSALDLEPLKKKEAYMGKRIKRGLYVSSSGTKINADQNGAMNIMRKAAGDKVLNVQTLIGRGQVDWPVKMRIAF